ncbi:hypothetical protein FIU83_09785 [Halomonas sp. THAF5a]|uniref:hypothetical protein n=1 Tax=Halomonas sp. THAF5a TaxID=2587844 RepID=UPI001267BA35|nr:hypothetical protein [Halomonas sp. THAF5a]QFU01932.1 hypothetical protein FIU83_09785 [Halomonas sp. THAF5a]
MNTPRRKERLVALIVLAALLFSPPLVLIASSADGTSRLVPYVFLAWGTLIALMAWLMERRDEEGRGRGRSDGR